MHYYKRNIGDYAKKAGKLSMLEHGAYTLLIDSCYDRERFPTERDAIEWCWARSEDEINAIKFVLSRFFVLKDGFFVQERIEEELNAYYATCAKNAEIATMREKKRTHRTRTVHDASRDVHESDENEHESPPNQEPLTINHKKNKDIQPSVEKYSALKDLENRGIDEQIAKDWIAVRKLKKLAPTKTAIDGVFSEIKKTSLLPNNVLKICCEKGWGGFKASWLESQQIEEKPIWER